ncbi:hypothetical protein NECAME_18146, partial [Necator americanus]
LVKKESLDELTIFSEQMIFHMHLWNSSLDWCETMMMCMWRVPRRSCQHRRPSQGDGTRKRRPPTAAP